MSAPPNFKIYTRNTRSILYSFREYENHKKNEEIQIINYTNISQDISDIKVTIEENSSELEVSEGDTSQLLTGDIIGLGNEEFYIIKEILPTKIVLNNTSNQSISHIIKRIYRRSSIEVEVNPYINNFSSIIEIEGDLNSDNVELNNENMGYFPVFLPLVKDRKNSEIKIFNKTTTNDNNIDIKIYTQGDDIINNSDTSYILGKGYSLDMLSSVKFVSNQKNTYYSL